MTQTLGIYCYKDKTFYYMEGGSGASMTDIDKLRTCLMARGLINIAESNSISTGYEVIPMERAVVDKIHIAPIYLNKHVESVTKSRQATINAPIDTWD